jgi:hypothetical protein
LAALSDATEPKVDPEPIAHNDIHKRLVEAGVKVHRGGGHHCPDIHVKANAQTSEIVKAYESRSNVTTFRDAEGGLWLDIPFAYDIDVDKKGS